MKRMACALLALVMAAGALLSACRSQSTAPEPPYEVPAFVAEKLSDPGLPEEKKDILVDFYYDNTISMDGFVRDQALKYGSPDGKLVRALAALRNVNQEYAATSHTMQPGAGGVLQWAEYGKNLYDTFAQKDFYTYEGTLPQNQGPLRALFYEEGVVNPENVNVFVTDLAEQNVNNADLAHHINDSILSQEGYAAAVIAMKLSFNGNASVPDPNQISSMLDYRDTHQARPYYIILTGPDRYLERYLADFQANFKEAKEGEDYYVSVYHPGNGVQAVSAQDIKTPASAGFDKLIKPELWNNPQFPVNRNLSVGRIENTSIRELFATDDYLNLFAFRYQEKNDTKSKRLVLNYFVPVRTDGAGEVAFTVGDRYTPTGNGEVDRLLSKREYMTFRYLSPLPSEGKASASGQDSPSYTWESLSSQLDLDNELSVSYENGLVRAGDLSLCGETDLLPQGYEKQPLFTDADYTGDFTPDTLGIHIRVEASAVPPSMSGSTIVFNLPVYAVSLGDQDVRLPDWVDSFNSGDTKDYVGRTYNLDGFYKTLFGLNYKDDLQLLRAQRATKIADITTAVTGLPVRKQP